MENPTFSVIIPAYNAGSTVGVALESVLQQNNVIQIVVVDDGSSDNTLDVVTSYIYADNRVELVKQQHTGPGAARNRGMRMASGEYVSFLDVDDRFEEGAFLVLSNAIKTFRFPDVVGFDFLPVRDGAMMDRSSVVPRPFPVERPSRVTPRSFLQAMYKLEIGYFSWALCYNTAVLKDSEIGFPTDGRLLEDAYFLNKLLRTLTGDVALIPEKLVLYTQGNDSVSVSPDSEDLRHAVDYVQQMLRLAEKDGSYDLCCVSCTNNLLYLYRMAVRGGYQDLELEIKRLVNCVARNADRDLLLPSDRRRLMLLRLGLLAPTWKMMGRV